MSLVNWLIEFVRFYLFYFGLWIAGNVLTFGNYGIVFGNEREEWHLPRWIDF